MKSVPALVLVTTSFPISGDGSEAAGGFVADLAEALAERVPVRVVAPGPATCREAWSSNVTVHRFAAPERPLSTLRPWRVVELAAIRSVLRAGRGATREAVEAGATQHILALWALPSGHWARSVSKATGVPYSVWTLGSDIWSLGRIPLVRGHLRRVLRGANHCYSDGLKLAEDTRKIAGRDVEFLPSTRRIRSMRDEPPRSQPPYRLLFLGRWHPNKGADLLMEALLQLSDEDWQRIATVEVCGGGPLESLVTAKVRQLQVSKRPVVKRGFLDKESAEHIIANSDFLLIPSRIESIPVVFSDSMKLGCPVIASPVGDLPSLVESGPAGVTAESTNSQAFSRAISKAIRMSAASFSDGVHKLAGRFALEEISQRIIHQAALDPDRVIGDA